MIINLFYLRLFKNKRHRTLKIKFMKSLSLIKLIVLVPYNETPTPI